MFEKLKSFPINTSLITFICFTIKILVLPATFPDSIILLCLVAGYSYSQYLKRFQPYKLDDAVIADLKEVKLALSKMNMSRPSEKSKDKTYW